MHVACMRMLQEAASQLVCRQAVDSRAIPASSAADLAPAVGRGSWCCCHGCPAPASGPLHGQEPPLAGSKIRQAGGQAGGRAALQQMCCLKQQQAAAGDTERAGPAQVKKALPRCTLAWSLVPRPPRAPTGMRVEAAVAARHDACHALPRQHPQLQATMSAVSGSPPCQQHARTVRGRTRRRTHACAHTC